MNILAIDVGGTNVKILATGEKERRKFPSGPTLTPTRMVAGVKKLAADWKYDCVSIGYPGVVSKGRVAAEPRNLAPRWLGFDFEHAFGCPVRIINDAAMQALGSYEGGVLLFIGLGTGLGSALVADGVVVPLAFGQLSYQKRTYEYYVGNGGLQRLGAKQWSEHVSFAVARLLEAFQPDDAVIGGGNAKKLKALPPGCRLGDNSYAFLGGFRLWESQEEVKKSSRPLKVRAEKVRADRVGERALHS
jgi:predicted NBD/HSP70 family sugar kinase